MCPLCGDTRSDLVWDRFRGEVADEKAVKCRGCGVVRRMRPSHGFGDLTAFYRKAYRETYFSKTKAEIDQLIRIFGPYQATRLDRLRPWLHPGARILEIGCGAGYFLRAARASGYDVTGIELDEEQAAFATREFGISVETRPLADVVVALGKFDLVCMFQLFEHLEDPIAFLDDVRKCLDVGARVAIEVPNLDNPLVTLYGLPAFKSFWFQAPHLFYFDARTLESTLDRAGFSAAAIESYQEMGLVNHINWMVAGKPMPSRDIAQRAGLPLPFDATGGSPLVRRLDSLFRDADERYRRILQEAGCGDILLGIFEVAT
jgi:2-polyprenyl-3-methyl-5-hydroxy-6-metoxy-1,4-benzoquinol methylase